MINHCKTVKELRLKTAVRAVFRKEALCYVQTYLASGQLWGFHHLNFNILGVVFQKNDYFGGYKNFVDIFWGSSQRSRYRMGDIFWVAKISNTFWDAWISWYLGGNGSCWAEPTYDEKMRVSPGPGPPGKNSRIRAWRQNIGLKINRSLLSIFHYIVSMPYISWKIIWFIVYSVPACASQPISLHRHLNFLLTLSHIL